MMDNNNDGRVVSTDVPSEGRIRSPRFTQWLLLMVFSIVAMSSALEAVERNHDDARTIRNQKYAMASTVVSFILTVVVVMMHQSSVASLFIVNTKIEGMMCLILIALQSATVAVVSEPTNFLAVDEAGAVMHGNLYYFTWAGFITSILLSVSYLRSVYHVDVAGEIRSRSARLSYWAGLLASSLVVMGSSANIYDSECDPDDRYLRVTYCNRTAFAISIGVMGTIASLLVVALKIATASAPFLLEASLSIFVLVLDAFGVAYITSSYGPGAPLGNLYYFSWGSFIASFFLSSSCFEEYSASKRGAATDSSPKKKDESFNEEDEGEVADF